MGFGATTHNASTTLCRLEDMDCGDEQGCNAELNRLEEMVSKDAMVWMKWKEREDHHI